MVRKQKRLGEMLIEAGLITEPQLRGALGRQKKWGGRLGTNLVKLGNIREEDLGRFLARQTGVQEMNISTVKILPHILKLVPKKIAEKYHLIPVAMKDKNTLIVSCADPTDLGALDHISFITGHKVDAVISTFASIRDAINRHYPGGTTLTGDESIALADDTMPTLVDMDDMTGHGGHEATSDPELIIFGNQSERLSPERQGPPPRTHKYIQEPREAGTQEFTLDFHPDWAKNNGLAPEPHQPRAQPRPVQQAKPGPAKSKSSADQKLKVLLRVLIKKGLISEAELRREWADLQAKGKL